MIQKASNIPADVLILDLEDSVPIAEKANAREIVANSLTNTALRGQRVYVRIDSAATGLQEDDLDIVIRMGLDGISVGKVGSAKDIHDLEDLVGKLEADRGLTLGHVKIIPWIETARAILNAYEICSSSRRVVGVAFGADDFTLDMGIERTKEAAEQFYPRAVIAVAAKAAEVAALDTPYIDFRDEEGLIRDSRLSKGLGFRGRFAIHPSQV